MTAKNPRFNKSRVDLSISRAGFAPEIKAKKRHTIFTILPSNIRANHYEDNHDRSAMYSLATELPELAGHPALADDRFCFRRAEVLARVESFQEIGQQEPIKVYRSNTHQADVGAGFLRHIAALYLEVTGGLADCPGMRDGLVVQAEEAPADPLTSIAKNHGENEALPKSPIDRAWLARRYETLGKTRPEIAKIFKVDKRSVDRLFQLLTFPASLQLDIHEGRVKMMTAINKRSKEGKGSSKGPRAGAKHVQMRRALEVANKRPLPTRGLSAKDVPKLIAMIAGVDNEDEEVPEIVAEWFQALTPTTEELNALKARRRKAPPNRPG